MKTTTILLLTLIFVSCKEKPTNVPNLPKEPLVLDRSVMNVQHSFTEDIVYLKNSNEELRKGEAKLSFLIDNYLEKLEYYQRLCTGEYNPFFEKGKRTKMTKEGKEFIEISHQFVNEISAFSENEKIKNRIFDLLNVENFVLEDGWQIPYIEYNFPDLDCETFYFLLENRKKNILLIENQMLLNK